MYSFCGYCAKVTELLLNKLQSHLEIQSWIVYVLQKLQLSFCSVQKLLEITKATELILTHNLVANQMSSVQMLRMHIAKKFSKQKC